MSDAAAIDQYTSNDDTGELRASGRYLVLRPDEAVRFGNEAGGLVLRPLMGGMDPDLAWQSLHLFERQVLPQLDTERS